MDSMLIDVVYLGHAEVTVGGFGKVNHGDVLSVPESVARTLGSDFAEDTPGMEEEDLGDGGSNDTEEPAEEDETEDGDTEETYFRSNDAEE